MFSFVLDEVFNFNDANAIYVAGKCGVSQEIFHSMTIKTFQTQLIYMYL